MRISWIHRCLVLCLVSALAITTGGVFASPAKSLKHAQHLWKQAMDQFQESPPVAEKLLQSAFNEAMKLTAPEMKGRYREEALVLAAKCLHPSLFVEVRIAIETYLSLYPKGKRRADVLIQKGLLEYAEGNVPQAEEALREAATLSEHSSAKLRKIHDLQLDGFLTTGKFRTAEAFLRERQGKKPVRKIKLAVKRFEKGHASLSEALKNVQRDGNAEALRASLEKNYFAVTAPEADLLLYIQGDRAHPELDSMDVSLLETVRTSIHSISPVERMEKLQSFLDRYPEADQELRGAVMMEMSSICWHEMHEMQLSDSWLEKAAQVVALTPKVEMERLLRALSQEKIDSPKTPDLLGSILKLSAHLPYDNDYFPVFSQDALTEMYLYSSLLTGHRKEASEIVDKMDMQKDIRTIPLKLLAFIATEKKKAAYQEFKKIEGELSSSDKKFVSDYLFPLYKPTYENDLKVLAATIVARAFPKAAITALLDALTNNSVFQDADHALALLADLYVENKSYIEAQSVWSTLRKCHPRSVWLR